MTQPQQQELNFQNIAATLQQRLAEKVANYEGELAIMKSQYEEQVQALQAEVQRLTEENETLSAKPKK